MIRDFLAQVTWELRASHFEHSYPGRKDEELIEEGRPLLKKYGAPLLSSVSLKPKPTPEQEEEIHRLLAKGYQSQLDSICFLMETAFADALASLKAQAIKGRHTVVKEFDPADLLQSLKEQAGSDDKGA
jgi:hypothetical protein